MKALNYDDLASKGIKVSKPQLWRWIRAGAFPPPFKIGSRNAWLEAEIDRYLTDQAAKRETTAA